MGSPVWSNRQPPRCLPGAAPGLCKHSWEGLAGRAWGRNAALPGEGPSLGFMGMAGVCGHGGWGGRKALWACLRAQVRSCLSKEHKRGVCWGHTEPPSAQVLTSHEGQLLLAVPRGGHEHPAVTPPLLPRAAVGLPSPPTAACFAPRTFPIHPTPSCPTSPTLALPQPPLRPLPKCPGPVLTPPSTPFLLLLLLHPTPKMHPRLSPLAEGWENAQEHMLALQKSLPPPQSGCLIKQAAGLGPAPGGSGSSTAAESPAERAERCREYQSVRLGHSQRFHCAGDPPEPAGTQQGSASLRVWGGESNWERGAGCLGGAGGRGREQGRGIEGVCVNVRAGGRGMGRGNRA